jgi:hypothetical protein
MSGRLATLTAITLGFDKLEKPITNCQVELMRQRLLDEI